MTHNNTLKDITSTFTNFITNQGNNTLENKLLKRLSKTHLKYADFLIGYLRISGFDKLANCLKVIDKSRILVGINIDRDTFDVNKKALNDENISQFAKEQIKYFNNESNEIKYNNMTLLRVLIKKSKLQIKVAPHNDIHAKLYIIKETSNINENSDGSVIIGSSNLTYNGLKANLEINTEIKGYSYIKEASLIFDTLWDNADELSSKDIDEKIIPKLKNYPPKVENISNENITPYQAYIKFLIEYFEDRIDFIQDDDIFIPKEYKRLSYQIEAVNDAISKLEKHNGFFLSDVVGLGKTVIIAMLIKKLESTLKKDILIVVPPSIKAQWEDTFNEFKIKNFHIQSLASLSKINSSKYEIIIVDESHKFKNIKSKRYQQLSSICRNKKVILLSATPQNNSPKDLYAQLNLFLNMKNSTVSNCENLDKFFSNLDTEYKNIMNDEIIDKEALKELFYNLRNKVVRDVMIRRTRTDIESHSMYRDDFISQGLSIPEVDKLNEHQYNMQEELSIKFKDTADILINKLIYARFNPLFYLTNEAFKIHYPNESDNIRKFNPLSGLMKISLVKRFESSFNAFDISINRHLKKYSKNIENFEKGIIYLGEKATDILDFDENINGDYDDFIDKLLKTGKVKKFIPSDFTKDYIKDLKQDREYFERLVQKWKGNKQDPKIDKFKTILDNEKLHLNKDKKIVVFTESIDTLDYLAKNLENKQALFITSKNREAKKDIIRENFDANYPEEKQKNDYKILVTTDTLGEGINLHRSNTIYNYDIPWNATKLIQRIGRVNRVGTKADFIYVHNFKPSKDIDELINLNKKAYIKLQSSHIAYGEDNKIYTEDEEVSTVKLFNDYRATLKDDKDKELDYLEELREFRDKNINEFNQIKNLTENIQVARKSKNEKTYLILKINNDKKYFSTNGISTKNISFLDMAQALKASTNEVAIKLNNNTISKHINEIIQYYKDSIQEVKQDKENALIETLTEQKATSFLKEWLSAKIITRIEFQKYKDNIEQGNIGINDIMKINNLKNKDIKENLQYIFKNTKEDKKPKTEMEIKVILAETFEDKI